MDELELVRKCLRRNPPAAFTYEETAALKQVAARAELSIAVMNGVELSRYMRLLLLREGMLECLKQR